MELTLNLVWALLAICMVWMWLRFAPRNGASQRMQFAALSVLVLILLPAVSITDDLLAAQKPAVVECWLRRDHQLSSPHFSSPHSILPTTAAPPLPVFAGLCCGVWRLAASGNYAAPFVPSPALAPIQNRPPPMA